MRQLLRTLLPSLAGPLAILLLVATFLSTPIARYDEVTFSSADLLQDFTLSRVDPGHVPGNRLLSDSVTQMQPWTMFAREEFAAGRAPLWNPRNGGGEPLLANYQSAVFSPFSLPFYAGSFKRGLLVSAFLKLAALGLFTYWFLRQLAVAFLPSLLGAVAFAFAGHNTLLLGYPHSAAMVALPAGMLFAEKSLQRLEAVLFALPGERRSRARCLGPLVGLSLALFAGLLAGHPESCFFAVLVIGIWCIARIVGIGLRARDEGKPIQGLFGFAMKLALAGLLAVGMAAFQVLPFLEYLDQSVVLGQRVHGQTPLDSTFWPLALFPDALGNPSTPAFLAYDVPAPNYETVNLAYVGGTVLFLALFSLVYARVDRRIAFFLSLGLGWVFYAYDVFGSSVAVTWIPGLGQAPMNRSQAIWAFCAACAAALALDRLLASQSGTDRKRTIFLALSAAILGTVLLVAFRLGAQSLLDQSAGVPSPDRGAVEAQVPAHVRWISQTFVAGILALCLVLVARTRPTRLVGGIALVLVAFLQTGWLLHDYNPVCEDRLFFPATPSIRALREAVGTDRVAILGEDGLPPETNLAYGLSTPQAYDGMWMRRYDQLFQDRFGTTHNWRSILRGSEQALRIFGVPWVLAKWNWNFLDSGPTFPAEMRPRSFQTVELVAGRSLTQTFRCDADRLQAVAVFAGALPTASAKSVRFRLEDAATGQLVHEQVVTASEIVADIHSDGHVRGMLDPALVPFGRPVVFTFPVQESSRNRAYRIVLTGEGGRAGDAVNVWNATRRSYDRGETRVGDHALPGELYFAWSCIQDHFAFVRRIGDYGLFHHRRALGKAWLVRGSITAKDDLEALELVRSPSFDPARLVVLSQEEESPIEATETPFDRRLLLGRGSSTIYLVCPDGRSIVPISNEIEFLVNHFSWTQVQTISKEQLASYAVVSRERAHELGARLRTVTALESGSPPPKLVEESPMWVRFEADCKAPEYLVISQAHYPGWKARVNGVEKPMLRANYAFCAVELQRGLNLVDLSYEPESFRIGLWIGLASLLVGVLCLFPRVPTD